jgi:hypothetical protein
MLTAFVDSQDNFLGYPIASVKTQVVNDGKASTVLTLPPEHTSLHPWPINSSLKYESTCILVTSKLNELAETSLNAIEMLQNDENPCSRYHLEGTAGLGKSVFGQILIHTCCARYGKEKVVFVYQPIPTSATVFIYASGKTFLAEIETDDIFGHLQAGWRDELEQGTERRIFWIFDSRTPIHLVNTSKNAALVLISSMGAIWDSSSLKKWSRTRANIRLIMSQWDYDDLDALRTQCFPSVSLDVFRRRFVKFGGNPRSVLEMAVDCDYEEKLGATIESLDIAQAMREIGNTRASVTADSSLVFYFQPRSLPKFTSKPQPFLQSGQWMWCSRWCLQKATDVLLELEMQQVKSFLRTARGGGCGALWGSIFESMVHRMVSTVGCTGNIRCLEKSSKRKRDVSYEFQLGPLRRQVFEKLDDISMDAYNIPLAHNFAAVDAFIPSKGLLLQMTVSQKHATKLAMIEKLKQSRKFDKYLRDSGEAAKLVFVVDTAIYDEFTLQPYKTAADSDSKIKPSWIVQYCLGIDIPQQLEKIRQNDHVAFDALKNWDFDEECIVASAEVCNDEG